MSGGSPYCVNRGLDKAYSRQVRGYDPENRKKY